MSEQGSLPIKAKKHFKSLDGLRGIAAIAVVVFHFMEIIAPDYRDSFIAHAYLAVDFFFCLSGFVVAYAYDDRLANIGKKTFFKRRLIRLQPLVIIGAIIGLLAFIFDPFSNLSNQFTSTQIICMLLSSALLFPYPIVPERYLNLFHYNPPTWSLFWEYIANIVYAVVLVKAPRIVLWFIFFISAGLLTWESYQTGHLASGFGGDNFWAGGIRVLFSFNMGLLLYRSKFRIGSGLPFWILALLLCLVFFVPYTDNIQPFYDPLIVIFYFPLIISLCIAGNRDKTGTERIAKWLGEISYPLYMIHYPFIWLFYSYVEKHNPSLSEMSLITGGGTLLLILIAHLVLTKIDEPIRRYLQR